MFSIIKKTHKKTEKIRSFFKNNKIFQTLKKPISFISDKVKNFFKIKDPMANLGLIQLMLWATCGPIIGGGIGLLVGGPVGLVVGIAIGDVALVVAAYTVIGCISVIKYVKEKIKILLEKTREIGMSPEEKRNKINLTAINAFIQSEEVDRRMEHNNELKQRQFITFFRNKKPKEVKQHIIPKKQSDQYLNKTAQQRLKIS